MFSAKQFLAFQYVFKTSWPAKNFYAEDVFKTCSRHLFGRSLRHLGDKKKSLQGGNLKKKSKSESYKSVCDKFIFDKSKTKLKTNRRALVRT